MSILATELDWPEGTKFFEVQCRLGIWDVDGWDFDKEPEVKTLGGTVRITPRTPTGRIRILEPDGKYRVVVTPPLTFAINEFTGKLVNTADNTEGVWVVDPASDTVDPKDFTYSAVVTPKVGSPFTVEFDGSVAINGVYDLANGTTVAPSRGVSVLESRIAKLEMDDLLSKPTIITTSTYQITSAGDYVAGVDTTVTLDNGQSLPMKRGQAIVAIDVAGQLFYTDFIKLAGPKPPTLTPGTLSATSTQTEITAKVEGAFDSESGLHAAPYRFSRDSGTSWTPWQAGSSYTFSGLTAGVSYNLSAEVRNNAGDVATLSLTTSTQEDPNAWGTLYFDDFDDAPDGDITGRAIGDSTWASGAVTNHKLVSLFGLNLHHDKIRLEFDLVVTTTSPVSRITFGGDGNLDGAGGSPMDAWYANIGRGVGIELLYWDGSVSGVRLAFGGASVMPLGGVIKVAFEVTGGLFAGYIGGAKVVEHQIDNWHAGTKLSGTMTSAHTIDNFSLRVA